MYYTGFQPWGELDYNPSWDVAQAAARVESSQAELLPVSFDVQGYQFEGACIHFGVAQDRNQVELERYAKLGNIPESEALLSKSSKSIYETTFPIKMFIDKLNQIESHWSFRESHDAGDFVCNALYYSSLRAHRERLFIHVPMMDRKEAAELGSYIGAFFASRALG